MGSLGGIMPLYEKPERLLKALQGDDMPLRSRLITGPHINILQRRAYFLGAVLVMSPATQRCLGRSPSQACHNPVTPSAHKFHRRGIHIAVISCFNDLVLLSYEGQVTRTLMPFRGGIVRSKVWCPGEDSNFHDLAATGT